MKTVRTIVKERLREKGWSVYKLAKLVEKHVTQQTVYNFVKRGSEMNSASLAFVLDALDLEIKPKAK